VKVRLNVAVCVMCANWLRLSSLLRGGFLAEITTVREAIAALVHDGSTLAMEGFTHLILFAAGHEIIRQRRRDLTLIRVTPDIIYDQMIGMGCATRLVFSWGQSGGRIVAPLSRRDPEQMAHSAGN
jgi:acyl CoA:acetate/3-ketoacid CoA transferase alpha subunit